jgi:hypothetical protein
VKRQSSVRRPSADRSPATKARRKRAMSLAKKMSTAAIAPTWMTAVNAVTDGSSTSSPEQPAGDGEVPVLDTGQELGEPLDDAQDDGVDDPDAHVGPRRPLASQSPGDHRGQPRR